jgi:acyl-CoA synthetase (AMP-forming)/AMP-acid ligase II
MTCAVHRTGERLRRLGIGAGDRVVLRGDNSAGYVAALLALAQLDTSLVLVDHRQRWAETAGAAARAGARWLVHDPAERPDLPGIRAVPYLPERTTALAAPDPGEASLAAWWRRADAAILWSSGSTGPPKGVVKSGPAILDNTRRTQRVMGYRRDDVLAPWLPFSHQYGMSLVLLWWLTGATLLLTRYHRLPQAVAEVVAHRATVVDAPPSTYHTLLRLLEKRPELAGQLRGVRYWGVGGAPLPAPLAAGFRDRLGAPLLDGYGLTETGNVALATADNPVGCGRPLPGVGVRIRGEDGRPAPAGMPGEIEVRSAGLMTGYLGHPPTGNGWYRTGDLGHLDEAGNLHVLGRRHAVHRHGHTLYPESIARRAERACDRPVTVIPVDDPRRGASLVFVVCDPAGGPPQRWRERLRERLPHHEHPNRVCVVDELPVTSTGKVDLARLRSQLIPNGSPVRSYP